MMRSTLIAALVLSGVRSYRMKRTNVTGRARVASELQKRSSQDPSLLETQQLDETVTGKSKHRSRDGVCLPHQRCTYSDCCMFTSCKTCPGGSSRAPLFSLERCTFKGHYYCNPLDCRGEWSDWSECSARCGGGHQEKWFTISAHPSLGGKDCPEPRMQKRECNVDECPDPIHCQGQWSGEWSECSAECGGGTQTMEFVVSVEAQYGGAECTESSKTQVCNEQECSPASTEKEERTDVGGIDETLEDVGGEDEETLEANDDSDLAHDNRNDVELPESSADLTPEKHKIQESPP